MFTADGSSQFSRRRPDWQSPTGRTLLIWEMKPEHAIIAAREDLKFYINQANASNQTAKPGAFLGSIAEGIPVVGHEGIFMDIYSPEPGIILYNAYKLTDDNPSIISTKYCYWCRSLCICGRWYFSNCNRRWYWSRMCNSSKGSASSCNAILGDNLEKDFF